MAFKPSLAVYHLRLRRHHHPDPLVLDRFQDESDLLDVLRSLMESMRRDDTVDEVAQVALRTVRIDADATERTVCGIVESGAYGVEHDIRNVETGQTVYRKQKADADMLPFYFLFRVHNGANEAQVVLQRNGNLGIFTIFKSTLVRYFKESYPELVLDLNPVIPEEIISERLRRGVVSRVRFVRFGHHPDLADFYATGDHTETTGTVELVVSAGRHRHFDFSSIQNFARSAHREARHLIEIRDFEYDTIKVEIDYEGQRQVVDLDLGQMPRAYYQVDGRVRNGPDGFPTFDSIHDAAGAVLRQIDSRLARTAT